MSANGAVRERFFVKRAKCVRCTLSDEKSVFWDKYKKEISEMALEGEGYDLDRVMDFKEDGEDFKVWLSEPMVILIAERDFRGYVISADSLLVIDQAFVDDMKVKCKSSFEVESRHSFSENIHNDANNSIDYVLYDLVTDGTEEILKVDVKKTLSEYLQTLQDDSFEEAALNELGIIEDDDMEDTLPDEEIEDEEIEDEEFTKHPGYEALSVEAVGK